MFVIQLISPLLPSPFLVFFIQYYATQAIDLDKKQNQPISIPDARFKSSVRYEPVGVAGLIIPWNYPLLMAAWKIAPCLAAGCTAILKPSELTPLNALEFGAVAQEIGLPEGVLNIVTGLGQAGEALSNHPKVGKIAFTGRYLERYFDPIYIYPILFDDNINLFSNLPHVYLH